MPTMTIALSDDQAHRLGELARVAGVAPEELLQTSVGELLTRPKEDCTQAEHDVRKNAEISRRLS